MNKALRLLFACQNSVPKYRVWGFVLFLIVLFAGVGLAQELTSKDIAKIQNQISKLQKNIANLKRRLPKAKSKKIKADILSRIDEHLTEISQLKKKLAAKPKLSKPAVVTVEAASSFEVGTEETEVGLEPELGVARIKRDVRFEIGGVYGFFAGATTFMGEVRVPLKFVFGPATTALRVSTGLAQNRESGRRYAPVNFDLLFYFPPGWFTGVENYLGGGLNYIALTSGMKQGTVGAELFYGVESEGFDGVVFGEMGYSALRTGFSSSQKGVTVMVGYRKAWGS